MKRIVLCMKAEGQDGAEISVSRPTKRADGADIDRSLSELCEAYWTDARSLAKALCENLPQGTLDRLVAELLKRKVADFVYSIEYFERMSKNVDERMSDDDSCGN